MIQQTQTKQLLKGWKKEKLGESEFEILQSKINKFNGKKDYLSTKSVQDSKIKKIECEITFEKRPSRANMQPIINSIWFAKMKNTIKVLCFNEKNKVNTEKYILSTGFVGISPHSTIPEYLKYYFVSDIFNIQKDKFSTGTTQVAINNDGIKQIEILYPESKQEQTLIVQEIETQFTRLDETVKFLKSVKDKFQVYRKAVLKKAFENGIETQLGKAFEIIMGQSPPSRYYNEEGRGLPFFQGKKEFRDRFPKISIWTEKYTKFANGGDLLVSIRAPIGPCNIAPEKCAIGRGIAAIKAKNGTESLLLFYLINYKEQELDSKGTGTTFKAISKGNLNSFIIKLPKKEDWEKVVQLIESKFSVIDKVEETVNQSLIKAEQLRKSILKIAFEGRLIKND